MISDLIKLAMEKEKIPILIRPYFNNAIYVRPSGPPYKQITSDTTPMSRDIINLSKLNTGGIIIGEGVFNPTTIAHELGHSKDTGLMNAIAPRLDSVWDTYKLPVLGTLAAAALGHFYPNTKSIAAAVNLGLQALSMTPTLVSELNANKIGGELYPGMDEKQKNEMFYSHLRNLLEKRMLLPSVVHGVDMFL